jgi:molybdenum cofactor sulfurtransferase
MGWCVLLDATAFVPTNRLDLFEWNPDFVPASAQGDESIILSGAAALEDGTPGFPGIQAVEIGLNHLRSVRMEIIHDRVQMLTAWLLRSLKSLQHSNALKAI